MPLIDYQCSECGVVEEVLYLSFGENERAEKAEKRLPRRCECGAEMNRLVSRPGSPILLGPGFYKPSPQGKRQTRTVDASKAAKEVLQMSGGKNLIKKVSDD